MPERQLPATPPFLRVNCADSAATRRLSRGWGAATRLLRLRMSAARPTPRRALLIRCSIQIDYNDAAFTLTVTLVLVGQRPAAESAHNMTLQQNCLSLYHPAQSHPNNINQQRCD